MFSPLHACEERSWLCRQAWALVQALDARNEAETRDATSLAWDRARVALLQPLVANASAAALEVAQQVGRLRTSMTTSDKDARASLEGVRAVALDRLARLAADTCAQQLAVAASQAVEALPVESRELCTRVVRDLAGAWRSLARTSDAAAEEVARAVDAGRAVALETAQSLRGSLREARGAVEAHERA